MSGDRFPTALYEQRLIELSWQFCRRDTSGCLTGDVQPDITRVIEADAYITRERAASVPLVASKVSLPDGTMPPVDVLPLLPDDLRTLYSTLDGVFVPEWLAAATKRQPKTWRHTIDSEYWELLTRLQRAGMLEFRDRPPLVINDFFVISKPDGTLRLIIDCRPTNATCTVPPHTDLPSPSDFSRIPPGFTYVSVSDLSDYYHTLLLPVALTPLFGLPPVRGCDVGFSSSPNLVFPVLLTLAMGWSHSVHIAQVVHERLLEQKGGIPGGKVINIKSLDPTNPPSPHDVLRGIYIDDVFNFGCSARTSNAALQAAGDAYAAAGFRLKDKKRRAAAQQQKVLGVDFDGVLLQYRVAPEKVQTVIRKTLTIIYDAGPVSVDKVRSLVGSWLWICLVRRPSLSVLAKTFAFTTRFKHGKARLSIACRRELAALCALAPALVGSMQPHNTTVMATDASTPGYGVTYCRSEAVTHLLHFVNTKGYYVNLQQQGPGWQEIPTGGTGTPRDPPALRAWVLGQTWLVALSDRFRVRSHINRQEIIATILALRWLGQQTQYWGTRVFLLCDSTVAVGALAKGRSSARALTSLCRRYAGLSLCFGIEISLIWVSTEINPADGPSRGSGVDLPRL